MPSKSEAQRRFFGMQLGKLKKGEKTDVNMPKNEIEEFASKVAKSPEADQKQSSAKGQAMKKVAQPGR